MYCKGTHRFGQELLPDSVGHASKRLFQTMFTGHLVRNARHHDRYYHDSIVQYQAEVSIANVNGLANPTS